MPASQPYPGVPYLQTLRRERGNWWRAILVTLAGAVGLVVLSVIAVLIVIVVARLLGVDGYTFDPADGIDAGEIFATNAGLAALIPLSGGLAWALYGVRPRWVSSNRPGMRWAWLGVCGGMAAVVWALLFALVLAGSIIERESPIGIDVAVFVVIVLLTTPLQAAGEEYLFRGVLLQSLGATRMPAWLCIGISALLFATAHAQFDPPLFADRFVLGAALAWLTLRTGGLEAGIAIHAVKNLAVLIPAALLEEVDSALDPQDVSWIPLAVDVVLLAIVIPWMLHVDKRWRRSGRLLPPSADAPAPAGWPPPQQPGGWPPAPGWQPHPPGWQPHPPGWQQPPPGYQQPPPGYQQPPPGYQPQPPPGYQQAPPGYQQPPPGYQQPPPGYQQAPPGYQPQPPPGYQQPPPGYQQPPPGYQQPPPGYQQPPPGWQPASSAPGAREWPPSPGWVGEEPPSGWAPPAHPWEGRAGQESAASPDAAETPTPRDDPDAEGRPPASP